MTTSPGPDPSRPKRRQSRKKRTNPLGDLETLLGSKHVRFESPEEPEERRSRLAIQEAQARHDRWRDKVLLYASLVGLGVIVVVCVAFLFLPGRTSESRTWAAAALSAIVNYSLGRAGKAT